MNLPIELEKLLDGMECVVDEEGMSKAQVKMYFNKQNTYYLKIEKIDSEVEREIGMYQWLKGKFPIPTIIYQTVLDDTSFLLMEKSKGEMLECIQFRNDPELLVRLAAKGILRLQSLDIRTCNYDSTINYKLKKARERIDDGLAISVGESIYTKDMETAEDVYRYLIKHKPVEELVYSHGDYCFNNYFTDGEDITGYIDVGRAGVGDKYQDIALCVRELRDYDSKYIDLLFELLGIEPDYEKIKYYILLDELF